MTGPPVPTPDRQTHMHHTYEIVRELSRTTNATISLVKHRRSSRQYVMKIMSATDASAAREIQILRHLHESASKAGRNHCISYLESFQNDTELVLVEEYADQGDALQWVLRNNPPQVHRHALAHELIQAVRFLHQEDIAHADLSLENIGLVSLSRDENDDQGQEERRPTLKVLDFGLSSFRTSRSSQKRGKAFYAPPELRTCGEPDSESYDAYAADVWSLGMCLFVLLTGTPLVANAVVGDTNFDLLQHLGLRHLIRALDQETAVGPAMLTMLERMIVIDPTARTSFRKPSKGSHVGVPSKAMTIQPAFSLRPIIRYDTDSQI